MSKVTRCPFCACSDIEYKGSDDIHYYRCMHCEAEGPLAMTPEAALKHWNSRPSEVINTEEFLNLFYANVGNNIHKFMEDTLIATLEGVHNE